MCKASGSQAQGHFIFRSAFGMQHRKDEIREMRDEKETFVPDFGY